MSFIVSIPDEVLSSPYYKQFLALKKLNIIYSFFNQLPFLSMDYEGPFQKRGDALFLPSGESVVVCNPASRRDELDCLPQIREIADAINWKVKGALIVASDRCHDLYYGYKEL